jgi:hypothetical protein
MRRGGEGGEVGREGWKERLKERERKERGKKEEGKGEEFGPPNVRDRSTPMFFVVYILLLSV